MKIQPQFNLRKAALYVIVINAMEIAAVVALAVLVLNDRFNKMLGGPLGDMLVVALAVAVTWGAVMDIREAAKAVKMTVKLQGLDETVTQMTDLNTALRAQRHDFLNHLQVVYSLIEMREYDEANQYIEHVYGDIRSVSRTMKTACAPVNALLRAKVAEAEKRGIKVEMDVNASWKELPLPAWEMCRVLSNLIDNAMDALEGTERPCLWITLSEDVKSFSFTVKNNGPMIPEKSCAAIFEAGVSGKGEGRGMGLYIARETMRNAEGDLTVESSEEYTAFSGFVPKALKAAEEDTEAQA